MRVITFSLARGDDRVGALVGDHALDLFAASGSEPVFRSMLALIESGHAGRNAAAKLCEDAGLPECGNVNWHNVGSLNVRAPMLRPRKNVFCVGLNYRSHIEQNAVALGQPIEIPDIPLFFTKPTTAIIGPGDAIVRDPRLTAKLDYEVELAAVVGKGGSWIDPGDVQDHLFGYTIVNDVSARDLQWRTSQFFYGKGLDTFCPMGPAIVTVDEVPPLDQVMLELFVNGELRQHEAAGNMLFPPSAAISELSRGITLEAGDVISLGTPGGCGYQMSPAVFLQPGDTVECRATGIGALTNPVAGPLGGGQE